jgi:hypothetical protein
MAGAPTPPLIQAAWANSAGPTYINTIPVSSTGLPAGQASYELGFPPLTMTTAGGVNPFGQDFNGINNVETANLLAWTAGQGWPFSATLATALGGYAAGAIVPMVSGAGHWLNLVGGNTNNPDTTAAATSGWVPLIGYGTTAITGLTNVNVTLTAAQAQLPVITFAGTLTGNVQIIFPTWTKGWSVVNNTTGNYALTCKTASGSGVIIPQYGALVQIAGDGTNIVLISANHSGSFTATCPDISGSPTITLYYSVSNGIVTLDTNSQIVTGTSTGVGLTLINLPAPIQPARAASGGPLLVSAFQDNGGWCGAAWGVSASIMTFQKVTSLTAAESNWTASGTKQIGQFSVSYPLK